MATYWMTFRLEDNASYSERYDALVETIRHLATLWWTESTSFLVFSSEKTIDGVASAVKGSINSRTDMALIGMPEIKSARLIGASTDQDLFGLMPFTKKV